MPYFPVYGDIVGPSSSTDNTITRYDGTTGKLIQGSANTIDDDNVLKINYSGANGTPKPFIRLGNNGSTWPAIRWDATDLGEGLCFVMGSDTAIKMQVTDAGILKAVRMQLTSGMSLDPLGILFNGTSNSSSIRLNSTDAANPMVELRAANASADHLAMLKATISKASNRGILITQPATPTANALEVRDSGANEIFSLNQYAMPRLPTYSTAGRPSASTAGVRSIIYNSDTEAINVSNGTSWLEVGGGTPSADRVIEFDTAIHSTVQDAVDEAEALSASDFSDTSGATVVLPSKFFDETVVISKNVSLVGRGMFSTKITQLEYRPSGTDNGDQPGFSQLVNINIGTLIASNETSSGSGVFNTNALFAGGGSTGGLIIQGSNIGSFNFSGPTYVTLFGCYVQLESTSYNVNVLTFDFSFSWVKVNVQGDDSDTDVPQTISTMYADNSYVQEVEISQIGGTEKPAYKAYNSYTGFVTANDNTTISLQGGYIGGRSLVGSGHTIEAYNTYAPFTPTTSSDWDTPPTNMVEALDELAARVRILEP